MKRNVAMFFGCVACISASLALSLDMVTPHDTHSVILRLINFSTLWTMLFVFFTPKERD